MDKQVLAEFYASLIPFMLIIKQRLVRVSAQQNVTVMQAFALMHVDASQPQPMHTLSAALGCDASNITGIIDGLERKGLIKRHENPADRRVKTIILEPKGAMIQQEILNGLIEGTEDIFSSLTGDELSTFAHILRKVTATCPNKVRILPPEHGKSTANV